MVDARLQLLRLHLLRLRSFGYTCYGHTYHGWTCYGSFGFRGKLSVLDGGLKAWTAAGGEVAKEEKREEEEEATSPARREGSGVSLSVRPVRTGAFVGKAQA